MSWPGNYFDLQAVLRSNGFPDIDICADPDQLCEDGYIAFLLGKFYIRRLSVRSAITHDAFMRDRIHS